MELSPESKLALAASIRPMEAFRTLIMPKVTDQHRAKLRTVLREDALTAQQKLVIVAETLRIDRTLADRVFAVRVKSVLQGKATLNRIYNLLDLARGAKS